MRLIISYLIGLVFGVGIAISGMANPAKVLNFFDIAGTWDPSLAFVMGGALSEIFQLPTRRDLDLPLIGGSAIFGIGWGIAGFCPGGALPALGTGRFEVLIFVAALLTGIIAAKLMQAVLSNRAEAQA
jgi:uncharacterized membrane protein YedE/YeeE